MGMVDVAKNIKSTMQDLRKPRLRAPSKSLLSPWTWKASLFFWHRLVKKHPPKSHVIKPSNINASSPPFKRSKSSPIPINNHTNYATNHSCFYYSYPNYSPNDVNSVPASSLYECYVDVVRTKVRSGASSRSVTPTTCDADSPNLSDHIQLPYFRLRDSSHVPLLGSTERLPLYIVS